MAVTPEQIQALANSLQITSGAFNDLLAGLVQVNNANQAAANSTLKNINARTVETELLQKRNEREQAMISLFQSLGSGITRTIMGLGNFTTQLYTSTNAFSAAKVSFEAFSDVFKTVTKIIKETAGVFSFLKGAGNVFETLANAGLDLAMNAFKNRLEQAQIITTTFESVGKAGATFGGSLNELYNAASKSGINLQEFGKFVAANIVNLAGYGQSVAKSAASIGQLTLAVGEQAPELLALKGSYKDLGEAAAEYMALQRQMGKVEVANSRETRNAVVDYIRQQNLLTEITGKSAAEQKRQAEERRNVAAYNVEASKLSQVERNNLEMVMNLAGSVAPEVHNFMLEFFGNQGRIMNAQNVTLANQFPELLQMFTGLLGNLNQPAEQFAKNMGASVQAGMPAVKAQMEQYNQIGFLQLGNSRVANEFIQTIARVIAGLQKADPALSNLGGTVDDINKQFAAGRLDTQTSIAATLIQDQNKRLVEIDGIVKENFKTIRDITNASNKIAKAIIETEKGLSSVANAIITGGGVKDSLTKFSNALKDALSKVLGVKEPTGRGSLTGQETPALEERAKEIETLQKERTDLIDRITQTLQSNGSNMDPTQTKILEAELAELVRLRLQLQMEKSIIDRQLKERNSSGKQEGGIATEPTIVGENNQPEAVIPLARGSIPLNINFDPMIRIMEQQREYLEEILAATNGNSDYLERIYHASS